jgi:hypothetical protein
MKRFWYSAGLTTIVLALGLTACKPADSGADGYTFEQGTKPLPQLEIKVVKYPSFEAIKDAYAKQPGARRLGVTEELQAFSSYNDKTCTIHMIDPAVNYQPEFFGHELVHCLYGNFHAGQDQARSAL